MIPKMERFRTGTDVQRPQRLMLRYACVSGYCPGSYSGLGSFWVPHLYTSLSRRGTSQRQPSLPQVSVQRPESALVWRSRRQIHVSPSGRIATQPKTSTDNPVQIDFQSPRTILQPLDGHRDPMNVLEPQQQHRLPTKDASELVGSKPDVCGRSLMLWSGAQYDDPRIIPRMGSRLDCDTLVLSHASLTGYNPVPPLLDNEL